MHKRNLSISLLTLLMSACAGDNPAPSPQTLAQLDLKKGQIVLCGPAGKEFGTVNFDITGDSQVKADFNTAVELLHSFEYDEAEKEFAKIIDEAPGCAMAYWGIAMTSYHPLWEPPGEADLKKGSKAIEIANTLKGRSGKETAYINAIAAYYQDWSKTDPHTRAVNFEEAMQQLHIKYPRDKEAAVFYALSLDASADPVDKTYAHQRAAGKILDSMYASAPDHPGIIHYIIHTYDYPGIADLGLKAARRYAEVAPSSAHALHMPSHIFTRLGLWDECIQLNRRSVDAARCYAQQTGIEGHWDEELHGLDYLVYAYLQKGDNKQADETLKYLSTIQSVSPINFKEAYTFAAAPTRAALENRNWQQASQLSLQPANFPWARFPWQEAIVHFGRLLGFAHTGKIKEAQTELAKMDSLHINLIRQKDAYKARQIEIQMTAGQAWIAHAKGEHQQALDGLNHAAGMEDSTSKHPVTPGEVLPAREQYADLLADLHQNKEALTQYQLVLKKSPNRFNSLYGAAKTAGLLKDTASAASYYKQLLSIADPASTRPELAEAKSFLKQHSPA